MICSMIVANAPVHAPDSILDQYVGTQQEEEQHALEDLRDRRRKAEILLRLLAADEEQRHQEAREEDADRIQPPDESHDDRREAVAARQLVGQLAGRARDFRHARDAGGGAADEHADPDHGHRGEAGVARRGARLAGNAHLEAG
jgi:hypothetical protein